MAFFSSSYSGPSLAPIKLHCGNELLSVVQKDVPLAASSLFFRSDPCEAFPLVASSNTVALTSSPDASQQGPRSRASHPTSNRSSVNRVGGTRNCTTQQTLPATGS